MIGKTTTAALQSGLVYGFAGQVDGIVGRIRGELGAPDAPVVATGGLADLIAPHSQTITAVDPELTLAGPAARLGRNRLARRRPVRPRADPWVGSPAALRAEYRLRRTGL